MNVEDSVYFSGTWPHSSPHLVKYPLPILFHIMSTIKKQKGDHINGNCSPENVLKIRHCIRKQLIENDLKENHISCWTNQQKNVLDLVRRTALLAESNSVLIIGPRGCGKTTLLTNVLKELNESDKENMMTVYMNGFLQTDDRIALKEITRQLRLENVVEDKVFVSGSDTKSILFVLDEFDLFCHHKNQTLLYNLFDIAQSAQTPIAVVGLTCRLDVIELFEKRVKSRFSHRQIYLLNQSTFLDYKHMFINLLSVSADTCSQNIVNSWNKHIKTLSEDKTILSLLQKMFDMDKSIRKLKKFLVSH
ncbi:Origin recognition complex subunit 4 [Nymphon striatum]|nr:Origin recognition complex subunit 4 [Nymphon striatum]